MSLLGVFSMWMKDSYYVRACPRGDYCEFRFLRRDVDEDLEYMETQYRCVKCLCVYVERIHAERVTVSLRRGPEIRKPPFVFVHDGELDDDTA